MAGIVEQKSLAEMHYEYLLKVLEVERALHPETYDTAARIGEELRRYFIAYGQLNNLKPIPTLDKTDKTKETV